MSDRPKAFILYPDQWAALQELNTLELGEVMRAVFRTLNGEMNAEKDVGDRALLAYRFMMLQIGIDMMKYEQVVETRRRRQELKEVKSNSQKLTKEGNPLSKKGEKENELYKENKKRNDKDKDKENERDNENCSTAAEGTREGRASASAAWQQNFIKAFNDMVQESNIPPIRKLTEDRLKKHLELCKMGYTGDDFRRAFSNAARSDFLNGRGTRNRFQATFDWLIDPANFLKCLEGNFNK